MSDREKALIEGRMMDKDMMMKEGHVMMERGGGHERDREDDDRKRDKDERRRQITRTEDTMRRWLSIIFIVGLSLALCVAEVRTDEYSGHLYH